MCGVNEIDTEKKVIAYSSCFIYPFLIKMEDTTKVISDILMKDSNWQVKIYDTKEEYKINRLQYFFPYVQKFLYPTANWPQKVKDKYLKDRNYFSTLQVKKMLKDSVCKRFEFQFNECFTKEFLCISDQIEIPCRFYNISLLLFPTGVGFIIFDVEIDKPEVTFDELITFNDLFRGLSLFHKGRKLVSLRFDQSSEPYTMNTKEFISSIIKLPNRNNIFDEGDVFNDKLIMYCYVALESEDHTVTETDPYFTKFKTMSIQVPDIMPICSEEEKKLWEFNRWPNTRMTFSPSDGGVIFTYISSDNADRRAKGARSLRNNIRNYYLDTLILALFKRMSLLNFSWELSKTLSYTYDYKKVSKLRDKIFDFSNRCWFSQLTNATYGQDIWEHWKKSMRLDELYGEVKEQLNEFDDYLNRKRQDRLTFWGGLIAAIGIPFTMVVSFYGAGFKEFTNIPFAKAFGQSGWYTLIATVLILSFFVGFNIRYHIFSIGSFVTNQVLDLISTLYVFIKNKFNNKKEVPLSEEEG